MEFIKKHKRLLIFGSIPVILWFIWMWMVGFHTGKYSRQETPFNVPGKIVKGLIESMAMDKKKEQLVDNFEQLSVGNPAPGFSLPGQEEGELILLSNFRGKVVLLEFWASWCGDCRRINGYLIDLYEQHHGSGFEILSISMDRSTRSWKKAIQTDKTTWLQACDGQGIHSEVMMQYGIFSLPRNFLLNKEGKIIGKDMSIKEIQKWLAENL